MEELQLAVTPARVDQRNFGLWINNWQIGQTLNAMVSNQLPTGELVLRVAGQQITATADIPIQQGANLLLEVKQLQPTPVLRVLSPVANAPANVGGTLQLLAVSNNALSSPPLASVVQSIQAAAASFPMLPALADSLGQLLRLVARSDQLSQPPGLAAALRSSGSVFEGNLLAAAENRALPPEGDFKGGLFRALAQIDAALAQAEALRMPAANAELLLELRRELEAGLGRITLHQLASQPAEGPLARTQHFEIPVLLAGEVHSLRIELHQEGGNAPEREQGADEDEGAWRVKLDFAPPALGAVSVSFRLVDELLDLRFAAERQAVRTLIDGSLPELERALQSRGLRLQATATLTLDTTAPAASDSSPAGPAVDLRA